MKRILALIVVVALLIPTVPLQAADGRKVAGVLLVVGGIGTMFGAFSYHKYCPDGYSTHTFQGLPTECVFINFRTGDSDVRRASPTVTLRRPPMLYAGAGAVVGGIVLLSLPKRAKKVTRDLDISVSPRGVLASKTITW